MLNELSQNPTRQGGVVHKPKCYLVKALPFMAGRRSVSMLQQLGAFPAK